MDNAGAYLVMLGCAVFTVWLIRYEWGPQTGDIPDQIGKLAELHKSGILSEEEFSEKKTQLLKRM
tara:strand:- start:133 stop:327 length:195 start_codon:yes stop_codon:yes gene_type:complete